jgi:hypothetical protein
MKYNWFRTKLKPNEIEIDRVDTPLQKADFLMKALRFKQFEFNRKRHMVGKDYASLEKECEESEFRTRRKVIVRERLSNTNYVDSLVRYLP